MKKYQKKVKKLENKIEELKMEIEQVYVEQMHKDSIKGKNKVMTLKGLQNL